MRPAQQDCALQILYQKHHHEPVIWPQRGAWFCTWQGVRVERQVVPDRRRLHGRLPNKHHIRTKSQITTKHGALGARGVSPAV